MPEPLHSTGASEDVTEEQTVHASLRSYANGPRGCTRGLTAAVWRRRCALWRASSSARRRGALEGFTAAVVWPLETVSDCVPCVEAGAPRQHRPNESNARQSLGEVLRFGARRRGGPLAREFGVSWASLSLAAGRWPESPLVSKSVRRAWGVYARRTYKTSIRYDRVGNRKVTTGSRGCNESNSKHESAKSDTGTRDTRTLRWRRPLSNSKPWVAARAGRQSHDAESLIIDFGY